jgi:transcriptional regulator with XRE-family HTH domain
MTVDNTGTQADRETAVGPTRARKLKKKTYDLNTIRGFLTAKRLELNLTLGELAKKIEISVTNVVNIENGRLQPTKEYLEKIEKALNCVIPAELLHTSNTNKEDSMTENVSPTPDIKEADSNASCKSDQKPARLTEEILRRYGKFPDKIPLSDRALIARINRKLLETQAVLKICRGRSDTKRMKTCGRYFIVFMGTGKIICNVDLEALARDIGCLQPYEYLLKEKVKEKE